MKTLRTSGGSEPAAQARPGGPARPATLLIDSPIALARLRRSLWLPHVTTPGTRIVLPADAFGAVAKRAEPRVNTLYASCGCKAGALAVLLTAAGLAAWWGLGDMALSGRVLLVDLGVLLGAALAGKLAGIAVNRMRLVLLLWRLERGFARAPTA